MNEFEDENLFDEIEFEKMIPEFKDGALFYYRFNDGRWVENYGDEAWDISDTLLANKLEVAYQFELSKQRAIHETLILANNVLKGVLFVLKKVLK